MLSGLETEVEAINGSPFLLKAWLGYFRMYFLSMYPNFKVVKPCYTSFDSDAPCLDWIQYLTFIGSTNK